MTFIKEVLMRAKDTDKVSLSKPMATNIQEVSRTTRKMVSVSRQIRTMVSHTKVSGKMINLNCIK